MPRRPTPYQYQSNDSPLTVASQNGLTPQQLIDANPGGYPFSTGQTINIPQAQSFQGNLFPSLMQPSTNPLVNPGLLPKVPAQTGYQYQPHGTYGQTISPTGYNNPVIGANGQPIGLHGTFGQSPNLSQPNIFQQLVAANSGSSMTPNNYDVNQRGRGFGQPEKGVVPDNVGNQGFYQEQLQNALNSPDKPVVLSSFAIQSMGIDPVANGYTYQNGNWILSTSTTAADTTSSQDQPTNPRDIAFTWNKYAKNRKSTFETNLKWAQNAWRRKRRQAKGGMSGRRTKWEQGQQDQQQSDVTGFGLVNFGASAG